MADAFLEYTLDNGYIHNWLVAGPQAIPVPDLDRFAGDDLKLQIARHYYRKTSDVHQPPIELGTFQVAETKLAWRYQKCLDDHLLDLSASYPICHYLRGWAYAQVMSPAAGEATFVLTTDGPADVWLNRTHAHREEHLLDQGPHSVSFRSTLQAGRNEILVRFEVTAVRDCPFVMALQITEVPIHGLSVQIPTWHTNIPRRHKLERLYVQAHVEHAVIVSGENVILRWDDEIDETGGIAFWVQDWREHIQSAGELDAKPAGSILIGSRQFVLDEGPYRIALTPPSPAVERYDIRYQEYLPFHVLAHTHTDALYGTLAERGTEALKYAANQSGQLYAEIARLALGRWGAVDRDTIHRAVARINQRHEGSVCDLVGLLGVLHRHPETHAFSQDLKQAMELSKDWAKSHIKGALSGAAQGDFSQAQESSLKHLYSIDQLLSSGRIVRIANETQCVMLDSGWTLCQVKITQGPHNGQRYWVYRNCLSRPSSKEIPEGLFCGFICGSVYLQYFLTAAICCAGIYALKLKSMFMQIVLFVIGMILLNLLWARIIMLMIL